MNIGKKGFIAILVFFVIIAVILSWDVTRNALFNGLGMFSVTLQEWVVGAYTGITTNSLYLQWHVLIQAAFWVTVTVIFARAYYTGKLNKLLRVKTAASGSQGYQNSLSSTIPVNPAMQEAPVQKVATQPPEVKKVEPTA